MDMVNPILEFASQLWKSMAGYASYIIDRKEYVTSLRMKTEELKAINNDVKSKVELGEQNGMKRTEQVQLWFTRVEETQNNVNMILQQNLQLINDTSTCFIIKCHCWSAYEFAKNAAKTLNTVTDQISEGRSFHEPVILKPVLPTRSETKGLCIMPMEDPVGIESDFQTIWEKLEDDEVGKIGLYGIGGVGKTTILKQINNELFRRGNYVFEVAIWVVASLKATEEAIQQAILQKLEIPTEKWGNTLDDNATLVYQKLEGIKFVLMLDDVWESLDLLRLGIPRPNNQNKSKIIFTTGSKVVCSSMKADWTIEIKCLPQEKALALFLRNVGEAALTSHHEIYQLARWVAGECKGLPLALVTVGQAMACKNTTKEWSHALLQLRKYPFEFPVVGKYVLPVLKFSYDSLVDSTTKECFVYCDLFPRGYEIASDGLVDLWMGEGYLNETCVKKARNHGFSIIEDLKRACLLQSGTIMPSWLFMGKDA